MAPRIWTLELPQEFEFTSIKNGVFCLSDSVGFEFRMDMALAQALSRWCSYCRRRLDPSQGSTLGTLLRSSAQTTSRVTVQRLPSLPKHLAMRSKSCHRLFQPSQKRRSPLKSRLLSPPPLLLRRKESSLKHHSRWQPCLR